MATTTTIDSHPSGELQPIHLSSRLNGQNYLHWSRRVRTYLEAEGLMSHLLETGPEPGEPGFKLWEKHDAMIILWLWSSMIPEISDTCIFLPTAKAIWDDVRLIYSKPQNAATVYEVKIKIRAAKQGMTRSVAEYASLLHNLWQELDHCRGLESKCTGEEEAFFLKKFIEEDRVYEFLAGLNDEFHHVRVRILGKDEVPSLNEVIGLVMAEERRKRGGIMMMMVEQPKDHHHKNNNRLWCAYCKKPRHTEEHCWKLNGKKPTASSKTMK